MQSVFNVHYKHIFVWLCIFSGSPCLGYTISLIDDNVLRHSEVI